MTDQKTAEISGVAADSSPLETTHEIDPPLIRQPTSNPISKAEFDVSNTTSQTPTITADNDHAMRMTTPVVAPTSTVIFSIFGVSSLSPLRV